MRVSWLLKLSFFSLSLIFLSFFLVFIYYAKDLPLPEKFTERQISESTKIYDRTGQVLLYEIYGEEKRTYVPLSSVPDSLKQAVIATEDANFYKHFGVDFKGIARAILFDFKIGKLASGGSTIPQQLIRSTFLSSQKNIQRKTQEVILAIELDRRYEKDQILEWYLNQVPFGRNAYGVEAASESYFNKSVPQLSLAESATLTALIQAPSRLSENKDKLLARRNYVLDRMAANGYPNKDEIEKAKKEEINFVEKASQIKAPYFSLWIKQQLEEKYGEDFLRIQGLKVYTSLDWEMQKIAEDEAAKGIKRNKPFHANNEAMVAINPKNGEVLAMTVGNGDYYASSSPAGCTSGKDCLFDPKYNVVVGTDNNPGRQPGSSFKPFIYATAFSKGYDDKTIVVDEPTSFGIWGGKEYIPQNYDGLFRGPVTLRQSLAQSLNVTSVKTLLDLAWLEDSIKTAQSFGITTLTPPYGPSIVLGGWEVKLLDMTSAYGVFANDGQRVPPVSILRIEDNKGNIIEENKKIAKRVIEAQSARLISDILSDNAARTPIFGPKSAMYFENYQVAVKTGTTQDYRDGWIIGYTPSIVVGVWVGNNNNAPMSKEPGIVLAGPIWRGFLDRVLPTLPKEQFPKPES